MKWIHNQQERPNDDAYLQFVSDEELTDIRRFHASFPQYKPTPLVSLHALSERLGVKSIHIKDESQRFGLNAFKVLGASYAIGRYMAQQLDLPMREVTFDALRDTEVRQKLGDVTFASTTDGNHGRGVAWMAHELGYRSVIYMPKGTTPTRLENIRKLGAEASITDMNYDDTVRYTADLAQKNGWGIIQDTAWEGYEDVPKWIMQGYSILAQEVIDSLGDEHPTHIILQAGVGAFAGAMVAVFLRAFQNPAPKIILVEPDQADCYYQSGVKGQKVCVTGDLNTIMAGLACGEPNPAAFDILTSHTQTFVSAPDWVAATGMRVLGNPLGEDERVISGESGAVPAGLVYTVCSDSRYADLKEEMGLDENARILLISTEGDTDPVMYRNVVWEGRSPKPEQEA